MRSKMKPPPARKREGGGEIAGYIGHAVVTPRPFPTQDQSLFTAVPVGPCWRVKALFAGHKELLGLFDSRLEALGAAVIFASRFGGQVVP
jgi:hypothetical protein